MRKPEINAVGTYFIISGCKIDFFVVYISIILPDQSILYSIFVKSILNLHLDLIIISLTF